MERKRSHLLLLPRASPFKVPCDLRHAEPTDHFFDPTFLDRVTNVSFGYFLRLHDTALGWFSSSLGTNAPQLIQLPWLCLEPVVTTASLFGLLAFALTLPRALNIICVPMTSNFASLILTLAFKFTYVYPTAYHLNIKWLSGAQNRMKENPRFITRCHSRSI